MNRNFYIEFEKRYRGSRELIRSRLITYQPLLEAIKSITSEPLAIDLGCGRGEWLELLSEMGFNAHGVDLDEGMLEYCTENGLNAKKADALQTIQTLDSDSYAIVSAFHLVEHISFDELQILVKEALRVLKPGGLLIMETPNPENITVGTKNFYLDPTHIKPIPSELLSFLPEYHGYKRVKVMGLQESGELAARQTATLEDVISGSSPDYAVVAQKDAATDILARFDQEFSKSYGLPLKTLARRYDQQVHQVRDVAQDAQDTAHTAEAKAQTAQDTAQRAMEIAFAGQNQAHQFHAQLNAVYSSYSWRITWPLRKAAGLVYFLTKMPVRFFKAMLIIPMKFVLARPTLGLKIDARISRFPNLRRWLFNLAAGAGLVAPVSPMSNSSDVYSTIMKAPGLEHLTPHARRIYSDLKAAIEQHRKETG